MNSFWQFDWIWRVGGLCIKKTELTDVFSCFLSFSNLLHSLRSLAYRIALTMRRIRRPINATPARDPPMMAAMFGPSGHSNTRNMKVECFSFCRFKCDACLKWIICPEMKSLSLFTHHHVVANIYTVSYAVKHHKKSTFTTIKTTFTVFTFLSL